jgi:hypothetical protein
VIFQDALLTAIASSVALLALAGFGRQLALVRGREPARETSKAYAAP